MKTTNYTIHETYTLDHVENNDAININYIDDKYFELLSPLEIGTQRPTKIKTRDFVYNARDYSEKSFLITTQEVNDVLMPTSISRDGRTIIRYKMNAYDFNVSDVSDTYRVIIDNVINPIRDNPGVLNTLEYFRYNPVEITDQYDKTKVVDVFTQTIDILNKRLSDLCNSLNANLLLQTATIYTTVTDILLMTNTHDVTNADYAIAGFRCARFRFTPFEIINDDEGSTFKIRTGVIYLCGFDHVNTETNLNILMIFIIKTTFETIDDNGNILDVQTVFSDMNNVVPDFTRSLSGANYANAYPIINNTITKIKYSEDNYINFDVTPKAIENPVGSGNYSYPQLFTFNNASRDALETTKPLIGGKGIIIFRSLPLVDDFNESADISNPFNFMFEDLPKIIDQKITDVLYVEDVPSMFTTVTLQQLDTFIPKQLFLKMRGCQNSTETIACNNEKEHSKIKNFRVNDNRIMCYLTDSTNSKIPLSLNQISFHHHIIICIDWKYEKPLNL